MVDKRKKRPVTTNNRLATRSGDRRDRKSSAMITTVSAIKPPSRRSAAVRAKAIAKMIPRAGADKAGRKCDKARRKDYDQQGANEVGRWQGAIGVSREDQPGHHEERSAESMRQVTSIEVQAPRPFSLPRD